ncbi:hypothetical protein BH10ACI1_BH10ACI1_20940 [soil metagenome]
MRKFFCASFFIFAFCAFAFAQTNQTTPCPTIEISRSTYFQRGEDIVLTANIQSSDWDKLNYNWKLSNNISFKGQGTPVIYFTAAEKMDGLNVSATIEISGLPENCNKTATEKFQIFYPVGSPIRITFYEKIPFNEEKAHLNLVYLKLKETLDSIAFFIISFTKKDSISAIKTRIQKITTFLTKTRRIPKEKFVFVFSEQDSYRTMIYLLPRKAVNNFPDTKTDLEKIETQRKNQQK